MTGDDGKGGTHRWVRRLSWATALGVVLGIIGPFGSYLNDAAAARIAYWTAMMWLGTLVIGLAVEAAMRAAARRGLPTRFAAAVATLAACVPLAAIGAVATRAVWPQAARSLRAVDWYGQTLFVAGFLVALTLWLERRPAPVAAQAVPPPVLPPAILPGTILCLQMEDHYVRIHRPAGSELLLMPLHQAIAALGARDGIQVHRSWWVGRDAVAGVESPGRAPLLLLSNGLRVPIARNRIAAVRSAGWLNDA